jgi:glycosyltransferase involved in cell wall biosynthesis
MTVKFSAVMPVHNEEAAIEDAIREVEEQLRSIGKSYEIICVDDGSTDTTPEILDKAALANKHLSVAHLSRNFGKESALEAGLQTANGDAVVFLDADLQHPPTAIPRMIESWEQGYDIVRGRKSNRGKEGLLYRFCSGMFNRFIGSSLGKDMRGSSDFVLLDRQVVDQLAALPERARFFRGLVNWVGFRSTQIEYEVEERSVGKRSWSTFGLIRYAANNILAFTALPLYVSALVGVATTLLGIILGIQTFCRWASGNAVSGFTTVILIIIFFAGITILSVGMVAVYLAKVLDEVKGRPVYIIRRETITPRGATTGS